MIIINLIKSILYIHKRVRFDARVKYSNRIARKQHYGFKTVFIISIWIRWFDNVALGSAIRPVILRRISSVCGSPDPSTDGHGIAASAPYGQIYFQFYLAQFHVRVQREIPHDRRYHKRRVQNSIFLTCKRERTVCYYSILQRRRCRWLPIQPLGPPLKAMKLYLWRLAMFSGLKLSGLNDSWSGYNSGRWCVFIGAKIQVVPFGIVWLPETISGENKKRDDSICLLRALRRYWCSLTNLYVVLKFPEDHRSGGEQPQRFSENLFQVN